MRERLSRSMNGEQDADYVAALTACQNVAELQALVEAFKELAQDAVPVVATMTARDWPTFQKGLKSERRGKFAGEAWAARYAAVLMPEPMMTVSRIAAEFKVPFGVAWARCRDLRPDLLKVKKPKSGPEAR